MLPSEVNNVRVQDKLEFDRQNNAVKYKEYTFFVNDQGPFTEKFYAGEQDTPAIERRINNCVAQLRDLGVINGGTSPTQES
jgi:hypothetical protein